MEKQILFNTEMVQAILEGRKTSTRRIIKLPEGMTGKPVGEAGNSDNPLGFMYPCGIKRPSYQVGDILWVREPGMIQSMKNFDKKVKMLFKADNSLVEFDVSDKEYERLLKWELSQKWLSPYWLTRETARIFLRVTDVRVQRVQDMSFEDMYEDGIEAIPGTIQPYPSEIFKPLWDSTIKKQDIDRYGWNANPWVWVISFERLEG